MLKQTIHEYNIKKNRSINSTPSSLMLDTKGFNTDANLESSSITQIYSLSSEEFAEIDSHRKRYFEKIGNTKRVKCRRYGLDYSVINVV